MMSEALTKRHLCILVKIVLSLQNIQKLIIKTNHMITKIVFPNTFADASAIASIFMKMQIDVNCKAFICYMSIFIHFTLCFRN